MVSPFERELIAERAVKRLPVVCAWCRVLIRFEEEWVPLHDDHNALQLSHGICPECLRSAESDIERWDDERT